MITLKRFENQDEQFAWIMKNRLMISSQRKSVLKRSDPSFAKSYPLDGRGQALKGESGVSADAEIIKTRSIINTTKLFDSHMDVHFDGLWKKSLSDTLINYLCYQHEFDFKGIITDEVQAMTKSYTWAELGYPEFEGKTQALVFDSIINKDRNDIAEFMLKQYAKGYVRAHSVRMRYIKDYLCLNSKDYPAEKDNWDKYYPEIVNGDEAKAAGFFWAVTEAKHIEGSAVVEGSNYATPTDSVSEVKEEPSMDTLETEPPTGTHKSIYFLSN